MANSLNVINFSEAQLLETVHHLEFRLDWSTRSLKHLQQVCPPRINDQFDAIQLFMTMKTCCEGLHIDIMQWVKAVDLPYMRRGEPYEQLFREDKPSRPTYMLPGGYYDDLIKKFAGKNPYRDTCKF